MSDEFTRLKTMIGQDSFDKLTKKHVAIFGLGGVGGFATETLARSGIGKLTIVDFDTVDITNINRQIIADSQSLGSYKTDVFEERLKKINRDIVINKITKKYLPNNSEEFFDSYDYIVDAIDIVTSKIYLIKTAYEKKLRIISSMGMGNRLNPSKIILTTLDKTSNCSLARVMRRELKKYGITKLKCVYSTEDVIIHEKKLVGNKMVNGSSAFVPSVAGITMASEIVRCFLNE
ncbi:ThiF family protein [Peptostreptococcaceae bacterium AS15]|nr:ThiF family protein [[Eubacterium] yurii subsp. margaretiae ATCC 43715]EJP22422.1 ThiF family protein [Peptostreptococcaceae bacterium AS15]